VGLANSKVRGENRPDGVMSLFCVSRLYVHCKSETAVRFRVFEAEGSGMRWPPKPVLSYPRKVHRGGRGQHYNFACSTGSLHCLAGLRMYRPVQEFVTLLPSTSHTANETSLMLCHREVSCIGNALHLY
jgi:hypothetical protein